MAKRVTFNKDVKSTNRSSKFDPLNSNSRKKNQKWNLTYFFRKLGLYLFYVWISTVFAIVLLKLSPDNIITLIPDATILLIAVKSLQRNLLEITSCFSLYILVPSVKTPSISKIKSFISSNQKIRVCS